MVEGDTKSCLVHYSAPQASSTKLVFMVYFICSWLNYSLTLFEWKAYVQKLKAQNFESASRWLDLYEIPFSVHHISSFPTLRSRWFPLAFHCNNIKANLVMLRNLRRVRWECCKAETFLLWLSALSCSSRLGFALLASKILLHSHFFIWTCLFLAFVFQRKYLLNYLQNGAVQKIWSHNIYKWHCNNNTSWC